MAVHRLLISLVGTIDNIRPVISNTKLIVMEIMDLYPFFTLALSLPIQFIILVLGSPMVIYLASHKPGWIFLV